MVKKTYVGVDIGHLQDIQVRKQDVDCICYNFSCISCFALDMHTNFRRISKKLVSVISSR